MKQHLKTKVLDDKALRLSTSSCQQQVLYFYVIPPCKENDKKEIMKIVRISSCTSLDLFVILVPYRYTLIFQKTLSDKVLLFSGIFHSDVS